MRRDHTSRLTLGGLRELDLGYHRSPDNLMRFGDCTTSNEWISMTFVIPDFWDAAMCARVRMAMDRGHASCAEIYFDGYRVDEDARRAFDIDVAGEAVDEVQRAIEATTTRVAQFFRIPLSGEEGPGFLRYACGGFYRVHRDVAPGWDDGFPRRISVVVFLTTAGVDCEGGSLRLYAGSHGPAASAALDIPPRAGMLVAFPSELPHEVLPVTAGIRDAVVDWFY
jgi:predicted 2-oxoglutarate/Fe(II)-dependent dioxygenase YbiX